MNKSNLTLLAAAIGLALTSGTAPARDLGAGSHARATLPDRVHHRVDRQLDRKVDRLERRVDRRIDKADRQVERTVTREDGSVSIDVSGVTGSGQTFERHIVRAETENGFTSTMEGVTPNGKTYNREVVAVADKEAGTWSKQVTGTTPSGKPFSSTIAGARTDEGFTRSATHLRPDGTVSSHTTVVSRADGMPAKVDVTHEVTPPQNGDAASE